MAQRIIILKRVEQKIKKTYSYLLQNWNEKVADDFYAKFEITVRAISLQPTMGRASVKKQFIRKKLITKHNCLYYKIKGNSIIVIDVLDTRRNPKRNSYE